MRETLFDFTSNGAALERADRIWYRNPLQPFSDILTPFSYSVLAEVTGSAWFRYYDRLGVELPYVPRNLTRHFQGRPYLNVKWISEQDVAFAGLEPMTFSVDGRTIPVCTGGKGGLLHGFRMGRNQKKVHNLLTTLAAESQTIADKSRHWYEKVMALRWTQAEILQIMEEIERVSVDSLMLFYAARHNLERTFQQLLGLMKGDLVETGRQINTILSDLEGLPEIALTHELLDLAQLSVDNEEWLQASSTASNWEKSLPTPEFSSHLHALLDRYGHWAPAAGEMRNPRWSEQPGFLLRGILACTQVHSQRPALVPSGANMQKFLGNVKPSERASAQRQLESMRTLLVLQSQALDAFAYILAGTRRWALAAAQEAKADGRIRALDEAFLFQLEELKRMMTGEWNVTDLDQIHALADQRQSEYDGWMNRHPGLLLFDDVELFPLSKGMPGVVGKATGPLRRGSQGCSQSADAHFANAVVGLRQLDSGWAPVLPVARGIVASGGSPLDPIITAARIWHVPTVIALGSEYENLVDGAQTTLDGATGEVDQ